MDSYGNIRGMRAPRLAPPPVQSIERSDARMDRGSTKNRLAEQEDEYNQKEGIPRSADVNFPDYGVLRISEGDWSHQSSQQTVLSKLLTGSKASFNQSKEHPIWHGHLPSVPETSVPSPRDPFPTASSSHDYINVHQDSKFQDLQSGKSSSLSLVDLQDFHAATFPGLGPSNTHTMKPQSPIPSSSPHWNANLRTSPSMPHVSSLKHLQRPLASLPFTGEVLQHVMPRLPSPALQSDITATEASEQRSQAKIPAPHSVPFSMPPVNQQQMIQQDPTHAYVPTSQSSVSGMSVLQPVDQKVGDSTHRQAVPPIPAHLLESLQSLHQHLPPILGLNKSSQFQSLTQQTQVPQGALSDNTNEVGGQKASIIPQVSQPQPQPQPQPPMDSTIYSLNNENSSDAMRTTGTLLPGVPEVLPQSQPPLPSGPPPYVSPLSSSHTFPGQLAPSAFPMPASSLPSSSISLPPAYVSPNVKQPPLPPGPPPASQAVSSSVHPPPSTGSSVLLRNDYNSLLSSLMAQGIISAPAATSQTPVPISASGSSSSTAIVPSPPTAGAIKVLETLSNSLMNDPSLLGFKQDTLRIRNDAVIKSLYSDLTIQCMMCGWRCLQQEEYNKHMDWHTGKKQQQISLKRVCRRWFPTAKEWLDGKRRAVSEAFPEFSPEDGGAALEEEDEDVLQAVPADESQIACFLCGEPFEDFFSEETEEWVYKGALYMKTDPDGSSHGPIVHVKCQSNAAADAGEDVDLVSFK
ncbi:hypothetical protein KP509_20G037600 [Ceratopteris richardii]|nr:hypothetical protein KP509_20G037600 [Ceratopteris richardii]